MRRYGDEPVRGRKHPERHDEWVVVSFRPRRLALNRVLIDHALADGEHSVHHGDVDELALAGAPRVVDGGQHAESQHHAGDDVANARPDLGGRRGVGAGDGHDASHGLRHHIEGRPVHIGGSPRAMIAEAEQGAVNQPGIDRFQRFIAQTEPVHDAGAEILDHRIGASDQLQEGFAPQRRLQVEADAPLVAVHALKIATQHPRAVVGTKRAGLTRHVPFRRLDLHDIRAMVGQHHRAIGACEHLGEVDHPDVAQRAEFRRRSVVH